MTSAAAVPLAPERDTGIWFVGSPAGLDAVDGWLAAHPGRISLDTETTGLDVYAPGFECGVLGFGHRTGEVLAIDGRDRVLVRAAVQRAFASASTVWAHNASYDARVLRRLYGLKTTSLRCSLVAARTAWPDPAVYVDHVHGSGHRAASHSLKTLRPVTADAREALAARWSEVSGRRASARAESWLPAAVRDLPADDPALLSYLAEDCVQTAALVEDLHRLAGSERVHIRRDLAVDRAWRWTGDDGLRLDLPLALRAWADMARTREREERHFGFDPATGSGARLEWVEQRGIGLPSTPAGKPSLRKQARRQAAVPESAHGEWRRLCEAIEQTSKLGKLGEILTEARLDGRASAELGERVTRAVQNKDAQAAEDLAAESGGLTASVHPQILANGARTGRQAIRNPALQNLAGDPFETADGQSATLRNAILPREGFEFTGADLAHVEPSVMAALSGDPSLVEHCGRGDDVYVRAGAAAFGAAAQARDEHGALTEEAAAIRGRMKVVFLALSYGMGDAALAGSLGLPSADIARDHRRRVLGVYPQLGRWIRQTQRDAEHHAPTTLWGRRLPGVTERPYTAVNYIVQGTAADIFKEMTLDVSTMLAERLGDGARLALPVHDELLVEHRPEHREQVCEILTEHMRTTLPGGVEIWCEPANLGAKWRKF